MSARGSGPVVYFLQHRSSGAAYTGATTDLTRRVRQHNGEIRGGARTTRRRGPGWLPVAVVRGFQGFGEALQFEYRAKHPRSGHVPLAVRRRARTDLPRALRGLVFTAWLPRWTERSLQVHTSVVALEWAWPPRWRVRCVREA